MHSHICFSSFRLYFLPLSWRSDIEYLKFVSTLKDREITAVPWSAQYSLGKVHCGNIQYNGKYLLNFFGCINNKYINAFCSLAWCVRCVLWLQVLRLIYGRNVEILLIEMEWVHLIREMHSLCLSRCLKIEARTAEEKSRYRIYLL